MDDSSWLELLEFYQSYIEKQDEVIYYLGKVVKAQATDLQLLRNDAEYSDMEDARAAMAELDTLKKDMEP